MKKIFIIALTALLASSCLEHGYEANYPVLITFDNISDELGMTDEEFYGEDLAYFDKAFSVSDIAFNTLHDKNNTVEYNGFALSISPMGVDNGYDGMFSVNAKSGADGSQGFANFCRNESSDLKMEHDLIFLRQYDGILTPVSCMVNNNEMVAKEIVEGPDPFEKGDWLKLTVRGYHQKTETGKAEIFLANFTPEKDSIMCTWTKLDLQPLGEDVQYIDFELTSSKPDAISKYFCLDNFHARVHVGDNPKN